MKTSDKLKVLAMEMVTNSNIPTKQKIEIMSFIKEKANPYQCIGYILDGKFYNLNEAGKIELKKRFLKESSKENVKHAASVAGVGIGAAGWALYRKIRSNFDECTKKCGTYKINDSERQSCMKKCKESFYTNKKNLIAKYKK
jgi:hypothetical protein